MAVFTSISLQDAQLFCKPYAAVDHIDRIDPIEAGTDNSNFILQDGNKKFILTIFEDRIVKSDLPGILAFTSFINERVISAPEPYKTVNGETVCPLKGKPAALVEYVEGQSITSPNANHAKQMGKTLAQMHSAAKGEDFRLPQNRLSLPTWRPIYENSISKLSTEQKAYADQALERLEKNWPPTNHDLPRGVIHADAFPDNVFFQNDKISGLIDFYFSCRDFYIYDFALTLNAWCFDETGQPAPENIHAFMTAYEKIRPLTPAERRDLHLMGMGAAFRIFVTRLRDWDRKTPDMVYTPKDPIPYLKILKFHTAEGLKRI